MIQRVVLLGAGNLAWHLAPALQQAGLEIVQIWGRTAQNTRLLAKQLGVPWACAPELPSADGDTVFFALPDGAIPELATRLQSDSRLWLHSSGSVPMQALRHSGGASGVWYAFQSFSKTRALDFSRINVFVEAETPEVQTDLLQLAARTGNKASLLNSDGRRMMHLAAVFANNFTNHMWQIAGEICRNYGIPTEVLHPLMTETLAKALELKPETAQTGPARRHDKETLQTHHKLLATEAHWQKIYTFVSDSIEASFPEF